MDRRNLLQQALLLVGASLLPGSAEALAAAVTSGKRQLDTKHYALLTALADTIVPKTDTPGALEAGVPQLVDALLGTWASPERRVMIVGALDKIDALAIEKHKRSFTDLAAADREALLIPHDAAALKPPPVTPPPTIPVGAAPTTVDPNYGRPKQEAPQSARDRLSPRFADPGYGKLKELIVVGYYCSEAALTSELRYEHNPGAWEPSIPVTPATRPWGGNALI
jgi:hypothetical protein